VELNGELDVLGSAIDHWIGQFEGAGPLGNQVCGTVRSYDGAEVARHLSPTATRLTTPRGERAIGPTMELYHEGERFWLVDDRWGIAEINLFKSSWRSWILPQRRVDPVTCAQMTVVWPLAQVVRGRGLWLLPGAVAVTGALVLGAFDSVREIEALATAGRRMLGARCACLRQEGDRFTLLPVTEPSTGEPARLEMVLIVGSGRRAAAHATPLDGDAAREALCRAWPMAELHRSRRGVPLKLAGACRCFAVQLSRRGEDFAALLESLAPPKPQVVIARPVRPMGDRRFVRPAVGRYVKVA
jgi:hypothetical protein